MPNDMSQVIDESGFPMMSEGEVEIIDKLLKEQQCKRCLEWGSGNSTVWFPKENPFIERWYAVEHNETYLELLGDKIDKKRTTIDVFPDKDAYIKAPLFFGGKFDFILVDGKWREECVDISFEVANEKAIILLHDCGWKELDGVMKKYADKMTVLCKGDKQLADGFYNQRGLALFKI